MAERRLRLLCFDGGGVRGLASLYLLKQVLSYVGNPMPCDFFDMICGTSTGGLIAIMLGRLEMSVDDCIHAFTRLMGESLKRKKLLAFNLKGKLQARYSTDALETVIKKLIRERELPEDSLMRVPGTPRCKTFVVALSGESRHPRHFTNWSKAHEQSRFYEDVQIWQAARATSAATSFFAPITIDDQTFLDGAFGSNNPVERLWLEAQEEFGPDPLEPQVRCVLSMGTGRPMLKVFGESVKDVVGSLAEITTSTEDIARRFRESHPELARAGGLYRFNPPYLDEVGLQDAKKRGLIASRTESYGMEQDVKESMQRFRHTAGEEQIPQTPVSGTSRNSRSVQVRARFFYHLDGHSDYLRHGVKSYWQHLTMPSYYIYEKIVRECKAANPGSRSGRIPFAIFLQQFDKPKPSPRTIETVWARLLRDEADVTASKYPPAFVMAVLYQLHAEQHLQDAPLFDDPRMVSIDTDRREALKRYDRWVACQCTRKCGKQWNFVNDIGLCKGSSVACDVEVFLQANAKRSLFDRRVADIVESMRTSWKAPRIQS